MKLLDDSEGGEDEEDLPTGIKAEEEQLFNGSDPEKDEDFDDLLMRKPPVTCHQQFTDFSNVFKAFIGSALIGLPFAMSRAGIVLGLIGLAMIGFATDHCCHLIVKCKRHVIEKLRQQMIANGVDEYLVEKEREHLGRTLSFGKIGKVSMGRLGVALVNTSILITQFGFCVGYFIFLGNTMRSVFYDLLHYKETKMTNLTHSLPIKNTSDWTHHRQSRSDMDFPSLWTFNKTNTTVPLSTAATLLNNFTVEQNIFTTVKNMSTATSAALPQLLSNVTLNATASLVNSTAHLANSTDVGITSVITHKKLQENNVWTFALLLVIPAPILILLSFIRNLRKMGPVSVMANASITIAFLSTAIYILVGFKAPHDTIQWFNWATFPVFFGQITGAYEGIGTVIPIEGSMAENRGRYPCYLHMSLTLLSLILGSFGILGYLRYGHNTHQIVTENLEGSVIVIILRLLLFVGVLFTYPLQIYPVIQILENKLLGPKRWCRSRRNYEKCASAVNSSATERLIDDPNTTPTYKISKWKSNIFRAVCVLSTAVVGAIFRSQFAYIAALTGSIGSSLLSYILPCVFHISLRKGHISKWIILKDILFIIFGIVGGVMGVTVTILEMIKTFGVHHPIKSGLKP